MGEGGDGEDRTMVKFIFNFSKMQYGRFNTCKTQPVFNLPRM